MSDRKVSIDITATDNASATVRKIENAFDSLTGKAQSSNKAGKELGGSFDATTQKMLKFGAGFLSAHKVAAFAKSCFDASVALDSLGKAYDTISGTQSGGKERLEYILETSRKLGLEFISTADAAKTFFGSASGTTLEKDMDRIFTSVSKAVSALSLSPERSFRVFLALGQMISKGKVHAEEMRGQLGENLPKTFQLAAKAMRMTTGELDKFMADGKLVAEDFLPKFADALENEFGQAAIHASTGAQQAVNRMSTEWTLFKSNILDSESVIKMINDVTASLRMFNTVSTASANEKAFEKRMDKAGWAKQTTRLVPMMLSTGPSLRIAKGYSEEQKAIARQLEAEKEARLTQAKQRATIYESAMGRMRQSFSVLGTTPEGRLDTLKKQYTDALEKIDTGIQQAVKNWESEDILKEYQEKRLKTVEYYTGKISDAEKS